MPLKERRKKVLEKLSRLADLLSGLLSDESYKKVLRLVELLFVLIISVLVILGLVCLTHGPEPEKTRVGKIIILLNDNWKVMLLLLIPLFYLPIKGFIERSSYGGQQGKSEEFTRRVRDAPLEELK